MRELSFLPLGLLVSISSALGACSSPTSSLNPDASAAADAAADTSSACAVDASGFACDLSTLTPNELTCTHWVQRERPDSGTSSCPVSFDWTTSVGGGCDYGWKGTTPPDPCTLPKSNGAAGTVWLRPACDAGCP